MKYSRCCQESTPRKVFLILWLLILWNKVVTWSVWKTCVKVILSLHFCTCCISPHTSVLFIGYDAVSFNKNLVFFNLLSYFTHALHFVTKYFKAKFNSTYIIHHKLMQLFRFSSSYSPGYSEEENVQIHPYLKLIWDFERHIDEYDKTADFGLGLKGFKNICCDINLSLKSNVFSTFYDQNSIEIISYIVIVYMKITLFVPVFDISFD